PHGIATLRDRKPAVEHRAPPTASAHRPAPAPPLVHRPRLLATSPPPSSPSRTAAISRRCPAVSQCRFAAAAPSRRFTATTTTDDDATATPRSRRRLASQSQQQQQPSGNSQQPSGSSQQPSDEPTIINH
ncbi:Os08g0272800, partial [Oryza sativa Japonica Group]